MTRHPQTGNSSTAQEAVRAVGACDPAERFEVVVIVRRQDEAGFRDLLKRMEAGDASAQPLSREDYLRRFSASSDDVQRIERFAAAHGIAVARVDAAARRVVLSGTVEQYNAAFGVKLQRFEHRSGAATAHFRQPGEDVQLPGDVQEVVAAVVGFDDRAKARPHFRINPAFRPPFRPARAPAGSFTPLQLAQLYDFPPGDGQGQCIALIEMGGGYREADLQAYFSALGVPQPTVEAVSVDGAQNAPTGQADGPDGEVTLDIEVAGALAPAARIAVYFAPNSEAGFVASVSAALHDSARHPSVISISWGGPEAAWTSQTLSAFDDALQTAAALGVTVCAAAGDSGSADGVSDGAEHVDFPASSPWVLGCGGTRMTASNGRIARETVWGDGADRTGGGDGATGGGISATFALPAWQKGLTVVRREGGVVSLTKRGVPDVSADADPATGYVVRIDGNDTVVGGTSAVAPLWAALIARINGTRARPLGFVNASLYAQRGAFNDVTSGSNGGFSAAPGWDACTGLGTPIGAKVAAALAAA